MAFSPQAGGAARYKILCPAQLYVKVRPGVAEAKYVSFIKRVQYVRNARTLPVLGERTMAVAVAKAAVPRAGSRRVLHVSS